MFPDNGQAATVQSVAGAEYSPNGCGGRVFSPETFDPGSAFDERAPLRGVPSALLRRSRLPSNAREPALSAAQFLV